VEQPASDSPAGMGVVNAAGWVEISKDRSLLR
jgi:hypothetical protein